MHVCVCAYVCVCVCVCVHGDGPVRDQVTLRVLIQATLQHSNNKSRNACRVCYP